MKRSYWPFLAALLILNACKNQPDIVEPNLDGESQLLSTQRLSGEAGARLEGVYRVLEGSGQFGDSVVVRWINGGVSIFGKTNAGYFLLTAGWKDSVVIFEGAWRYAVSTETGPVRLRVSADEGGAYLLGGSTSSVPVTLRGAHGFSSGSLSSPLVLRFIRPFSSNVTQHPFWILAHRGGGSNSSYLGASENTVAMISHAERRGADGVELDIHVSADGVLFLYHDEDLNLRLVQRGVLWGSIESYTWPQLRTMVRLVYGERISSLDEALDFIVRQTTLKFVWLDLKSSQNEVPAAVSLQRRYLQLAQQMGRKLEIVLGISDDEHIDRLQHYPDYTHIPSVCELEEEDVRRLNAQVWAPRWTLGTLNAEVEAMHAEGRRVFTWTLDDPAFIERFFAEGNFDGMLTNYPTLIAYYRYIR